jgi:divalent metal cation (Fe/Co/Zn/Cd) transporter
MPLLGASKLVLARRLESDALRIEAEQTIACAWFSLTTLAGLLLNATLGWWWADPLAALALVPWMAREGLGPWRSPP